MNEYLLKEGLNRVMEDFDEIVNSIKGGPLDDPNSTQAQYVAVLKELDDKLEKCHVTWTPKYWRVTKRTCGKPEGMQKMLDDQKKRMSSFRSMIQHLKDTSNGDLDADRFDRGYDDFKVTGGTFDLPLYVERVLNSYKHTNL